MRKHINGLSSYVAGSMHLNVFEESVFVFCGKSRTTIKILYWERNGFCLWVKRLERDKFPWPATQKEAMEISRERLLMLLSGIDFWHEHKAINYTNVI